MGDALGYHAPTAVRFLFFIFFSVLVWDLVPDDDGRASTPNSKFYILIDF